MFFITDPDLQILKRIANDYRAGNLTNRPIHAAKSPKESGHIFGKVSEEISAASGTGCPGKGKVKILAYNIHNSESCLQESAEEVAVLSPSPDVIPVGSIVQFQRTARDGQYWILPIGGGQTLYRFELTGSLTLGGDAPAVLLEYQSGSWVVPEENEVAIRVYDFFQSPGMWAGEEEYQGWCVPRPDTYGEGSEQVQAYDIVWMEQISAMISWEATEDMGETNAGEMSVNVLSFDHQGKDPGSTVTVYVPDGRDSFDDVVSGAKGTAYYDYSSEEYRIISCEHLATHATAGLTADCCGDTATVSSFAIIAHGEYLLPPGESPSTCQNSRGHAGASGDSVLLIRTDAAGETWDVIDVTKHSMDIVTDVRVDELNLQYKKKAAYIEWCDDAESEWQTWHTGTECDE